MGTSTFTAVATTGTTTAIAHGAGCLCGRSRRGFMAGAMATGVAALSGKARAQTPAKPRRIDVHHHMLPPRYIQMRLSAGTTAGTSGIGATEVEESV